MLGEGEGNGGIGGKIVGERETVKKNGKNTRNSGHGRNWKIQKNEMKEAEKVWVGDPALGGILCFASETFFYEKAMLKHCNISKTRHKKARISENKLKN